MAATLLAVGCGGEGNASLGRLRPVGELLMRSLLPHQEAALAYGKPRQRAAFYMEMRLGKTMVAIRWAKARGCDRNLVLAPLAVLPVWAEELALEEETSVEMLTRAKTGDRLAIASQGASRWYLLNFEGLRTCQQLTALPWSCVIVDESTRIRNPKAKITLIVTTQFRRVRHKAVLSGLPAPESALDYYTQFQFLDGEFMGCYNYWQFRKRYFQPDYMGWNWTAPPRTLAQIKKVVHQKAFVLTRRQAGIGSRKIYERRVVEMTDLQRKEYKRIRDEFTATFGNGEAKLTPWTVVQLTWLSRVAGGFHPDGPLLSDSKIHELMNLLTGELATESVVIWFRYNAELRAVADRLASLKISHGAVDGSVHRSKREIVFDGFKNDEFRVLLMQLKVGKFGINLSTSSTAIYFSNSYDMEDRAQSEERILSPTKHEPLLYVDLITKDSIDEVVLQVLREKKVESRFFMQELLRQWKARSDAAKY